MSKNELTEVSTPELIKTKKTQTTIFSFFCVIIIILIGTAVYRTIQDGVAIYTYVPLIFLPLIFKKWQELQKIQDELKSRNI